jgi:hypothetical protein
VNKQQGAAYENRKSQIKNRKSPDDSIAVSALFKFRAGHEVTAAGADHHAALGFEAAGADRGELVGKLRGRFGLGGLGGVIIHDAISLRHSVP